MLLAKVTVEASTIEQVEQQLQETILRPENITADIAICSPVARAELARPMVHIDELKPKSTVQIWPRSLLARNPPAK